MGGTIECAVLEDALLYIGGTFTTAQDANGSYTRNRAACLDLSTGLWTSWAPNVNTGSVLSIASSASGIYLGGSFTSVNGTSRNFVARVNRGAGTTTDSWNPNTSSQVFAIEPDEANSRVWIGGAFTSLGSGPVFRNAVAMVDTTNGACLTAFDSASNDVRDILYLGSSLYISGLGTMGPASRHCIAKVNPGTGANDAGFNANITFNASNSVRSMCPNAGGTGIYIGGIFATVGGSGRNKVALINATTGAVDGTFNPNVTGSEVRALHLNDGKLYIGGASITAIGGTATVGAGRVDAVSGVRDTYDINANAAVHFITSYLTSTFFFGPFTTVEPNAVTGGVDVTRNRIAAYANTGPIH